jgi:hypothetical protein
MSSSRREVLKNIALSASLAGLPAEASQHVHEEVREAKKQTGAYQPKLFNDHEYKTVRRLAELIVPADDVSGSALDAGAPEFIDLIASNSEKLSTQFTGGIAWLDRFSEKRTGRLFVDAPPAEQTAMLDIIAFRKHETPELAAGIRFFDWMRRLTTDAFYTHPIGVKDLGFIGNKGMRTFQVPTEAIEYAVKRSGLE